MVQSAHLLNYQNKTCNKDGPRKSKAEGEYDYKSSKYYSNLEAAIKSKGTSSFKAADVFMMNTNTNHHYVHNPNGKTNQTKDKSKGVISISNIQNDNSFSNMNSSFKGKSPVIGISSVVYSSNKNGKKQGSRRAYEADKRVEDPAIPFPNSQKHQSSKLGSGYIEYLDNR